MSSLAHWIGARAADVVAFFRDKPFVPCQVDWDEPCGDPDVSGGLTRTAADMGDSECSSCHTDCCLTTDTIAEMREWNSRK